MKKQKSPNTTGAIIFIICIALASISLNIALFGPMFGIMLGPNSFFFFLFLSILIFIVLGIIAIIYITSSVIQNKKKS